MSSRGRDLLVLFLVALVARVVAVILVPWPPFTDPAYYSMIAQRLAEGHGFTTPVMWSFIEVGSVIPDPASLPIPSNAHWMPLTSIVAAASMAVFGPTYVAGTVPLVVLSALLVPLTYLVTIEIWGSRGTALLAAALAIFAGPLFILYPTADNFAVFGATGAASLYCSMRAVRADRPGPWLVAAGAFAGLATLVANRWRLPCRRGRRRLARPARLDAMAAASHRWGNRWLGHRVGGGVRRRAGTLARPQPRGLRHRPPVGRRAHPMDPRVQRAVLDRARGEPVDVSRLGMGEHHRLEALQLGRADRADRPAPGGHLLHLLRQRRLAVPTPRRSSLRSSSTSV